MEDITQDNIFNSTINQQQKLNVITRNKQTHKELAQYLHATCLSPRPSAFIKAIKNNHFISWPGLNQQLIIKHLPKTIATSLGHLTSERQGLQSTKNKPTVMQEEEPPKDIQEDYFPSSEIPNV